MKTKRMLNRFLIGLIWLLAYGVEAGDCHSGLCLSPSYSESPNDTNLPPDPGLEGKLTLLGIDSDNDGIRDDVFRYVAMKYWNDPYAELIYMKKSIIIQNILRNGFNASVVERESEKLTNIARCLASMYLISDIQEMDIKFSREMFNTVDRFRQFYVSQSLLAGNSYEAVDPSSYKEYCNNILQY